MNNGYVYELDNIIVTPKSLLETIEGLSDQYSIFKNAILSRNVKTFDRNNSLSIGVDESGNTVYDSVFTVKNPYFLDKGFSGNFPDRGRERESGAFKGGNLLDP